MRTTVRMTARRAGTEGRTDMTGETATVSMTSAGGRTQKIFRVNFLFGSVW